MTNEHGNSNQEERSIGIVLVGPGDWYNNLKEVFKKHGRTWLQQKHEIKGKNKIILEDLIRSKGFILGFGHVSKTSTLSEEVPKENLGKICYAFKIDKIITGPEKIPPPSKEEAPNFAWYDDEQGECEGKFEYKTWLRAVRMKEISPVHYRDFGLEKGQLRTPPIVVNIPSSLRDVVSEILSDDRHELSDKFKSSKEPRFWLIAPGEKAEYWDVCIDNGIICVGWKEAAEELREKLLEIQDKETFREEMAKFRYTPQDYNQLWKFLKDVSNGDIVLAKKGAQKIIGIGVVKSGPEINLELDYPIYRRVKWYRTNLDVTSPKYFAGTITEISNEEIEKVPELKKIIEEVINEESDKKNGFENSEVINLLEDKKQVILYGPPGTGKTWLAKKFVDKNASKTYTLVKKDVSEGVKFFWWTINPSEWDYNQLKEGKSEEMWHEGRRMQKAFEDIEVGDVVFIYVSRKVGKIYAVGIYEEKEGKPYVKVQKIIDGPRWKGLKEDKILRSSLPVKMGARGTLFPLTSEEGLRIIELSNLNLNELDINVQEIQEEVKRVEFVTFHPSYSYEEFVEGLKPVTDEEGNIKYEVEDGIFKRICKNAYNALMNHAGVNRRWEKGLPELDESDVEKVKRSIDNVPKFFLIIDEINRGDVSKVFGELITLLEADKRLFAENEIITTLPYSKEQFGVPPNLYIIGTMNTADRSIALIDVALRRRFGFIEVMLSYKVLINELGIGEVESEEQAIEMLTGWTENEIRGDVKKLAIKALYILNQKIQLIYDRDHQIGHSYLLKLKDGSVETLKHIWYHEVVPLLQEYFYNDWERLKYLLGDGQHSRSEIIPVC